LIARIAIVKHEEAGWKAGLFSCAKLGVFVQVHSSGVQQTNAAEQPKFRNN